MLATILLEVACICLSVTAPKPIGWAALALSILALLSTVAGWPR
jgi:hypothetical protein